MNRRLSPRNYSVSAIYVFTNRQDSAFDIILALGKLTEMWTLFLALKLALVPNFGVVIFGSQAVSLFYDDAIERTKRLAGYHARLDDAA